MAILTEQRERRDAQPIPVDADDAAEKFVCGVYRCNLSGKTCRDYHAQAKITRSMAREACIDCAAGAARLVLLGDGDTPGRASICQERTAKGGLCTNPPIKDGYCHIHRKDRIQMPQPKKAPVAKPAARTERAKPAPLPAKRPAREPLVVDVPVDVEIAVVVETVAPPAPVKIDMVVAKAEPATPVICRRPDCGRPAHEGGRISDYCRQCGNTAYMTLKKGLRRVPTDDERREWLASTPVSRHLRDALAKARRGDPPVAVVVEPAPQPAAPPAPSDKAAQGSAEAAPVAVVVEGVAAPDAPRVRTPPPGSKGIDWSVQPLGKLSDLELGDRLGCSATAVRTQRKKRGIPPFTPSPSKSTTFKGRRRMQRHKARLEIGERLCKLLDVKSPPAFDLFPVGDTSWGFRIDAADPASVLHVDGDLQFNTTCWRPEPPAPTTDAPAASVTPVCAPEPPAGNAERTAPAGVGLAAVPTVFSELPDHLVIITIPINRRAFAELERMAAAGLHGDDPCDAARTLILDGLRRHALVRP